MKRFFACLLTLLAMTPSLFALGVKWEVETTNALPYDVKAFHGETFTLEAVVKERGSLLKGAATVTFYYQTPEMASHEWYTTPAQWSSDSATCRLAFTPALDVGNDSYRFFFGIVTSQGANYRAYGTLRLKPSPGFNAATLEPIDIRDKFKKEILAEVLQSLDSTFAPTEHDHTISDVDGLQAALNAKQDTLTAGENITIENGVINAAGGKIDVDTALSSTSTNPVQNKVIKKALDEKATYSALSKKADATHYHYQYVSADSSAMAMDLGEGFELGTSRALVNSYEAILGATEINGVGYIAWRGMYDGLVHRFALGGGGNTEVWKGNVGFGEQDTFIGAKKTADGDGQFQNGYPRLHNHGQDIHEVSGFSRDSRDDETVWSHRLLLPWDVAKANDTSYLMAGVVWEGSRNIFANGDTATFVQPLLPTNNGSTKSYLPYAIPCFENSPVFWKGTIVWNDGTQALSKAVQIPWSRVQQDMRGPDELALKRDVDQKLSLEGGTVTGDLTLTQPLRIQNGSGTGSLWIGGNVNSGNLSNKNRHLARIVVPSFNDVTKGVTLLGFDSSGDSEMNIKNKTYDVVSFGGSKKITNATSPMGISFCVTKTRESMSAADKIYPIEMDANEVRFNVQPQYDGTPLATTTVTDALDARITALESGAGEESPWVSPGDWHLTVRSSEDYATVSTTEVATTTLGDRVMGDTTVTTHASPIKDVSVEMLDLSMPSAPIPVTFTCEGATLTPSSSACRASATTEGLYRIFATDAEGRTRDAYLNLRTKTKSTTTKAYVADVEGSARKVANDRMLSVLAARDRSNTIAVGQTSAVATCDKAFNGTTPLTTAPLAPSFFCCVEPKTSWGPDAVAVAPHFAVTAAHWSPSATKTATFVTPDGSVSTVSGTTGTSLTAWARSKGYSESEIDEADIDDIYVWHFTSGTIPDACIPYVMDLKARQTYYKNDLTGIMAYTVTQNGYLSYAPLTSADGGRFAFGTFTSVLTRADLLTHLAPACCATIYGGDSGRPILMIHEEKPVLLSTFCTAYAGPSFVRACDILDAYIKERSGGTEALKRIE